MLHNEGLFHPVFFMLNSRITANESSLITESYRYVLLSLIRADCEEEAGRGRRSQLLPVGSGEREEICGHSYRLPRGQEEQGGGDQLQNRSAPRPHKPHNAIRACDPVTGLERSFSKLVPLHVAVIGSPDPLSACALAAGFQSAITTPSPWTVCRSGGTATARAVSTPSTCKPTAPGLPRSSATWIPTAEAGS